MGNGYFSADSWVSCIGEIIKYTFALLVNKENDFVQQETAELVLTKTYRDVWVGSKNLHHCQDLIKDYALSLSLSLSLKRTVLGREAEEEEEEEERERERERETSTKLVYYGML